MMSGIRGKNTRPEIQIRKALHAKGFRYNIHDKNLPGKPDISFPRYKAVIQVNGCFWHAHDCHLFKLPSSNKDFWLKKINRNKQRDTETLDELNRKGIRVLTVWECAMRGRTKRDVTELISAISDWLTTDKQNRELTGTRT